MKNTAILVFPLLLSHGCSERPVDQSAPGLLVPDAVGLERVKRDRLPDNRKETEAWSAVDRPTLFAADLEYHLEDLPLEGEAEDIPWAGSYWPVYRDTINHRWAGSSSMSPAAKYGEAFGVEKVEDLGYLPDLVVLLEETYPFRRQGFIDSLVSRLVREGLDSLVPVKPEYRSAWIQEDGETRQLGGGMMPRRYKDSPVYVGLPGLGCVTHPAFLREGRILGPNVGIQTIDNTLASVEVRGTSGLSLAESVLPGWWLANQDRMASAGA